jgi:hypothetical protein
MVLDEEAYRDLRRTARRDRNEDLDNITSMR